MVVSGQDRDTSAALPVPDANRLYTRHHNTATTTTTTRAAHEHGGRKGGGERVGEKRGEGVTTTSHPQSSRGQITYKTSRDVLTTPHPPTHPPMQRKDVTSLVCLPVANNAIAGVCYGRGTRLVIRGRDDPRVLVVELHRPDVVQVPQQGEQATPKLVVPDLVCFRVGAGAPCMYDRCPHIWGERGGGVEGRCVLFIDRPGAIQRHTTGAPKTCYTWKVQRSSRWSKRLRYIQKRIARQKPRRQH